MADFALGRRALWRAMGPAFEVRNGRLFVELCDVTLENPVGLAAGYDKNCELIPSLSRLGFGYLTVGTVTESPRPGNPKPRVFRLPGEESLINGLGFPSNGLEAAARSLERAQDAIGGTLVIVSVGGTTVAEFVRCHRRLEPLADAIELNISSPNTEGLRAFQKPEMLKELIGSLSKTREKPLVVKLPSYATPDDGGEVPAEERARLAALARACVEGGVDALTVANSRPTPDSRLSTGSGGLSGRKVFDNMLTMVADVKGEVGDSAGINACGGVSSGEDAWKALQTGATTVQLLTSLVYRGPGVAKRINQELLEIMDREGVDALMYPDDVGSPPAGR